jgi:hypothetical protein
MRECHQLTAESVIAAFESLPYAFQTNVLNVLERVMEKRHAALLAAMPKLPEKSIPLHDPKADRPPQTFAPRAPTQLAPIDKMLNERHPHIGKSKPYSDEK